MSLKTVGQLKDSIAGILTGTNLDNITDLDGGLSQAARILARQIDAPESSGREAITLYDGVFDYPAPTTIFGGALVDLRPQGISRDELDYVYKKPVELFDRTKHLLPNGYQVAFEYNKGVPIIRIAQTKAQMRTILDTMAEDTGWTIGGSGSSLTEDETVFYDSPASLRFTATGASTATMTKTLSNSLSLASYEDVALVFVALRVPSSTSLTSMQVKIGSSASAYNNVSVTQGFLGAWQANDWLLVAFDLASASQTGTPNFSAINYVQISLTHSATMVNVRLGGIFMALPSPHEILFQSAAIFNVNGVLSNDITNDDDIIILNDDAYTCYEHQGALTLALRKGGKFGKGVVDSLQFILHDPATGLYPKYRGDNPSEEIRLVGSYYD